MLIEIQSFLFDEFLLNGVGNRKVDVENFVDKHLDDLVLISLEVLTNFVDLDLGLSLQCSLELFILFL